MPREHRVLVVDDDDATRKFVRVALESSGIAVDDAASGDEAMAKARSIRPDLILLDISLPDCSGLELVSIIRSDSELGDVPIVMLTASADEATEWRARDLGATAYVAKPVDVDDLERLVTQLLAP